MARIARIKAEGEVSGSEILRRVGVLYEENRRAALEKRLADYHF